MYQKNNITGTNFIDKGKIWEQNGKGQQYLSPNNGRQLTTAKRDNYNDTVKRSSARSLVWQVCSGPALDPALLEARLETW